MKENKKIKYAIFGFMDKETGKKLRTFFKKHTGKDINFNDIHHYKNGFKLLKLSIPLKTIETISITEAINRTDPEYKRFHCGVEEFIDWYEKTMQPKEKTYTRSLYYLVEYDDKKGNMGNDASEEGIINFLKKEHFICTAGFWGCPWYFIDIVSKTYKPGRPGVKYGTIVGNKAISFETFKKAYETYKNKNGVEKITIVLSNGLSARIPTTNWRKTINQMEENIRGGKKHG